VSMILIVVISLGSFATPPLENSCHLSRLPSLGIFSSLYGR
jgi:hypothetical protein